MMQDSVKEECWKYVEKIPDGRASEELTDGCLVLEGGAFRGLYTQGVLDFWMLHNLNIRDVIGVSAGALSAVAYVSGQIGRSARTNIGYRHDSNYIGVSAFRKSHSLINLDFLLQDLNRIEPLDEERFNDERRLLTAATTDCATGETLYFNRTNCTDMTSALKASASIPFIAPMVGVEGKKCLDGGCSCNVPYQWALDRDYGRIVVVKTHDSSYRITEPRESFRARSLYLKHQKFAEKLDKSDFRYNREYDELDRLESEGRIFIIQPSQPVTVSRIEGDPEKLYDLYRLGYDDASKSFCNLAEYLGSEKTCGRPVMRDVTEDDAEELLSIYEPYVRETAITFETEVPSVQEFQKRIARTIVRYPYIASVEDGRITGYAYAGPLKNRSAYDISAETTIYVRKDCRSRGTGRWLCHELEKRLKAAGIVNAYACISHTEDETDAYLDNASEKFHGIMGYKTAGTFHGCGLKFGRKYDVIWMEKLL